jgi:ABC-type glutathione transport system ATPase component
MGLIMITHNMGVVAETADRVIVQYKGRKMEEADVLSLFESPKSDYTRALLSACRTTPPATACRPSAKSSRQTANAGSGPMTPVLEGKNIVRNYFLPGGLFKKEKTVHAVKGVNFKVEQGKTLAIVGESGCGKSTLARIITLIDPASDGELFIDGKKVDIAKDLTPEMRRKVQIVFQNPYGSLNPRQKIGDILGAADHQHRQAGGRAALLAMSMLKKVGLQESTINRYPHMFSGGQRQRIAIARALMLNPACWCSTSRSRRSTCRCRRRCSTCSPTCRTSST